MKFRIGKKNEKIITSKDVIRLESNKWEDFSLRTLLNVF